MYIDLTYIVLVLPAVLLSLWASWNVQHLPQIFAGQQLARTYRGGGGEARSERERAFKCADRVHPR